jgi:hypothetical protein
MAKKFSQLPAATSVLDTDLLAVLIDPGGAPETKKITLANLLGTVPQTGWTADAATWTYVSPTTFTITGNVTVRFPAGTKLKLTNGTVKYFYVVSATYGAPNTTITVTGGSDYVLAAGAISATYYSYADTPQGFPNYFAYTPVWSSSGTAPVLNNGTLAGIFSIAGKTMSILINQAMGSTTTYGTGTYKWSLPFAPGTILMGSAMCLDAGTAFHTGAVYGADASNVIVASENAANIWSQTIPHTWAATDYLKISMTCFL